jgi:hypothetical protein
MSGQGAPLRLYRIVKSNPPTTADFLARMMLGFLPRRIEMERPEVWSGLSMYDTPEQARATANDFPALGTYVATVSIDTRNRRIVAHQTLKPGHYTVWGAPEVILAAVDTVEIV